MLKLWITNAILQTCKRDSILKTISPEKDTSKVISLRKYYKNKRNEITKPIQT